MYCIIYAEINSSSTGTITGTPTVASSTTTYTVTVTDQDGDTASASFTLTVDPTAPAISTATLPSATYGANYSQSVAASGTALAWSLAGGSLPAGLGLNSATGVLSGVPTAAGGYTFTVKVTDSFGQTASQAYTLTVAAAGTSTTLSTTTGAMSSAGEGVTLTAIVTSATSGTPAGTVSFYDNGGAAALCTVTLSVVGGSDTAVCTATLPAGTTDSLTAAYNGDTNFNGSSSSASAGNTVTVAELSFTLAAYGPAAQTVMPGSAASYVFNITPTYGVYAATVKFTASGLPAGATATFSPATIAADGGKQSVTLTIQTAAAAAQAELAGRTRAPLLLALLLPLLGLRRKQGQGRRLPRVMVWAALLGCLAAAAVLPGCGGGGVGYFNQAPKNYTVTVTATTGSVQQSFNVTLNVQ